MESRFSPVHRKGDHLICRQGLLGADGSISHPTTPDSQLASPRCVSALCLSRRRWPVSWSSLRVTWNVQRSGLSSQKGKRAGARTLCVGCCRAVTKQHDLLAAAHLPVSAPGSLRAHLTWMSHESRTRRTCVGCLCMNACITACLTCTLILRMALCISCVH